jgi:hypothetical protein
LSPLTVLAVWKAVPDWLVRGRVSSTQPFVLS